MVLSRSAATAAKDERPPGLARGAIRLAVFAAALAAGAAFVVFAYQWRERSEYASLNEALAHQLDLYAASLDSELGRHAYLPGIVALDGDVQALLEAPNDAQRAEKANKRLTSLNVRAGSLSIFVMDGQGLVRAASNWYQPESTVGQDLSAMPFFAEASKGNTAHAFARSALRDSPEYYFAQPVMRNGKVAGIAVVRISLEPIESTWIASGSQSNQEIILVLDQNDAIILASEPDWRNKKAQALTSRLRATLAAPGAKAAPDTPAGFNVAVVETREHGNQLVRWAGLNPSAPRVLYATQNKLMASQGWRLITLTNASGVSASAWQTAFGAGALAAFLGLLAMFVTQRRRAIASRLRAREALQKAHDELEQRIALRTTELYDMNQELLREIGERKHAEQVLRESQDELIHAGKLALLGQMSAGITHEISQPLTALRSLAFNTALLLKRGDLQRVENNLQSVSDLTERMGRLTEQLKSFSRKTPLTLESFTLQRALDNTLLLLENRIRTERIVLTVDAAPGLRALCDGNRLEQVLINLCANAMDAMRDSPVKQLTLRVWSEHDKALIRVSDSGTGIDAAAMKRLFEPFFSTKPQGEGLGLGLAISADIVREFGGALRAFNIDGGAAFELTLPLLETEVKEASHV